MEKTEESILRIFYPSMRFDIETVLQVADCWEQPTVEIYTIVEMDADHGKETIEPIGIPMCMEKVKTYIKRYLESKDVHEFEEPVINLDQSDESEDDECWILSWQMDGRAFILYYYEGFDPFGDYWPDRIDKINSFIHTNGPIDLDDEESDFVELLEERCETANVYASLGMAKKFWVDKEDEADEIFEFADESGINEYDENALYFLGDLASHI